MHTRRTHKLDKQLMRRPHRHPPAAAAAELGPQLPSAKYRAFQGNGKVSWARRGRRRQLARIDKSALLGPGGQLGAAERPSDRRRQNGGHLLRAPRRGQALPASNILVHLALVQLLCAPLSSANLAAPPGGGLEPNSSGQPQFGASRSSRGFVVGDKDDAGLESSRLAAILVSTKHGTFRGVRLPGAEHRYSRERGDGANAVAVGFLGIRYASAPVRRLRFMPPTQFRYAANQLHEAQKFGPICVQRWPIHLAPLITNGHSSTASTGFGNAEAEVELGLKLLASSMPAGSFRHLRPLFARLLTREQSEDCLNLNVYAPLEAVAPPPARPKLPVLVIIHGESLDFGAGSAYDAHRLVGSGSGAGGAPMLVVTFNYRLNIFGFLPKLAAGSRGLNLGLMDQIAALHWIKDNIGAFGGSSSNITLMGTKRGALLVNLLMLSPMAKGLFHRAIMEDGSALSPIAASHEMAQQSVSVRYLRILAKLCDCPATSSSRMNFAADDMPKIIDCLRYKSLEQLTQRVPLELLQLDAESDGEVSFNPKYASELRPLLGSPLAATAGASAKNLTDQLAELLKQISLQEASRNPATNAKSSQLFELVYGFSTSSAASVRPLFGPIADGSLVPDEDFAAAMLKEDSNLAHLDLLIGLTHPILSVVSPHESKRTTTTASTVLLDASNHLSERILAINEAQGLTNEQATSLVNAFVRSSYRFHNQEIANSILSHYLGQWNVWLKELPVSDLDEDDTGGEARVAGDEQDHERRKKLVAERRRAEFLLSSVARIFQDSLTDVPLLRVAVIHSIKQMDSLVEAFVEEQFANWRRRVAAGSDQQSSRRQQQISEDENFPGEESFAEQKLQLETFSRLSEHFLENIGQSVEPPTRAKPKRTYLYQSEASYRRAQPKTIELALERLLSRQVSAQYQEFIWSPIREHLRNLSVALKSDGGGLRHASLECAHYPSSAQPQQQDDLAGRLHCWSCARRIEVLQNFVATGDVNGRTKDLHDTAYDDVPRFERIPLDQRLAELEEKCSPPEGTQRRTAPISATNESAATILDAASGAILQSAAAASCRNSLADTALALLVEELYLLNSALNNDDGDDESSRTKTKWNNFNVFSQQIATLQLDDPTKLGTIHRMSAAGGSTSFGQVSLATTSSFWSSFVAALNCNKTQPVLPSALLDGPSSSSANSTLLNLSLQFTCQQGSRSAQNHIDSLVARANQRLAHLKGEWLARQRQQQQQPTHQDRSIHHSLRMANLSQSGGADESSLDAIDGRQQQPNASSRISTPEVRSNGDASVMMNQSAGFAELKIGKSVPFPVLVVFVLCGILLLSSAVLSGACLVIVRRRRRRCRSVKEDQPTQMAGSGGTIDATGQVNVFGADDDAHLGHEFGSQINRCDEFNASQRESVGLEQSEQEQTVATNQVTAVQDACLVLDHTSNGGGSLVSSSQMDYDPPANANVFKVKRCPSESTISHLTLLNGSEGIVAHHHNNNFATEAGSFSYESADMQPIILPILSNDHHHRQLGYSTLDNRHFCQLEPSESRTSMRTQRERPQSTSSSTTATIKKRVKIRDPHQSATEAALNGQFERYHDRPTRLDQMASHGENSAAGVQLLCPIHSKSLASDQYLTSEETIISNNNNLFAEGYVTISDPQARWLHEHPDSVTMMEQNCDYLSSATNPLGIAADSPAMNQLQLQPAGRQYSRSQQARNNSTSNSSGFY